MLPYFDTSLLIKLYVTEEGSEEAESIVKNFGHPTLSEIVWIEFHSAMNRKKREGNLSERDYSEAVSRFSLEWDTFGKIHPSWRILLRAAELVQKHPLATLDSIHLASALTMAKRVDEPVLFLTSDFQLEAAARKEKLRTHV